MQVGAKPSKRTVKSVYSRLSQTPGPGAYNHQAGIGRQLTGQRRTRPKWSMSSSVRFDAPEARRSPGPQAYVPPMSETRPNYSFGRARQRPHPGANATPAPNAYSVTSTLPAAPAYGFGFGERDVTFGAARRSPGPAVDYIVPSSSVGPQVASKGFRGGESAPVGKFPYRPVCDVSR